jgi:3-phosphoglycerate kinase
MELNKKTIANVDVKGKTVLMRVDFNVPLEDGEITDDRRIQLSLESIRSVINRGGRLVLASHLGRPKGIGPEDDYSLAPCADRLSELLPNTRVTLAPDCIGDAVDDMVLNLDDGDVLLLENLRFHHGEKDRDLGFAAQLAALAEIYCHESFGTAHRKDASMIAVPDEMARHGAPRVAGFLLVREIQVLSEAFDKPRRPFIAILGGAKVSDKLVAIDNVLKRVDTVLIGGGMAYTFLAGQGAAVGSSLVEPDFADKSVQLIRRAEKTSAKLLLPLDHVCGDEISDGASAKVFDHSIPSGWMGLDIGPKTVSQFTGAIANAKTIYWNGPVGAFEAKPFARGTRTLADVIALATAQHGATSIVGGGESAAAVVQFGVADRMTHVSTGGGASLHMLEGHKFHSVESLDERR